VTGTPRPPPVADWSASVVGLKRKISRALRLGGGPSEEELEEVLRSEDREAKLAMLRRVMRETPRVATGAAPEPAFTVVQAALAAEPDAHVLSYLVRVASHAGGAATVRVLAPLLGHADARVVANTLEALALTDDETVFTLAVPLIARSEPRIRATALAVMCKFDRAAAMHAMVNYLKNARDTHQRHGALFALRAVGGLPAPLLQTLQAEVEDPEVKEALARILEEGTPEGLPRLMLRTRHTFALALTGHKHGSILASLFPRRAVIPTLAAATLILKVTGMVLAPHDPAAAHPLAAMGPLNATSPAAVARAGQPPPEVDWTGIVRRAGDAAFLMAVDGVEVRVEFDGRPLPRPGARVRVRLAPEHGGAAGGLSGHARSVEVLQGPASPLETAEARLIHDLPAGQAALLSEARR